MKVSKPIRKCKDMTVNTDITFQSYKIIKSQNYIQYNKPITTDERETKKFAYVALKNIVLDKRLLNDLKYLTDFNHTGILDVYHSLYNKYIPKRLHFSYPAMIARVQLSVLDFNSRDGLAHRKNKQGYLQYKHQFSKITQSWVVKKNTKGKKRKRTKIISWMRKCLCKWHPLITKCQS